jgi:hypothetical protein
MTIEKERRATDHAVVVEKRGTETVLRLSISAVLSASIALLGIFVGALGIWISSIASDNATIRAKVNEHSELISRNTAIIAQMGQTDAEIKGILEKIRDTQLQHYGVSEDNNKVLTRNKGMTDPKLNRP